jgi:hypothetical protein
MGSIRAQHDEYSLRFAAALNQVQFFILLLLFFLALIIFYFSFLGQNFSEFFLIFETFANSLFDKSIFLQLENLRMMKEMEPTVSSQVKEDMYLVIVDGFQLLSEWTGRVWEQSAWKFSRPTTELSPFDTDRSKDVSDYEKVKKYIYK